MIHVEIDLNTNIDFPIDGLVLVEDLVVAFGNDIGIGNDVIVFIALLCSFSVVPGITDVAIRVGTAAMPVAGSKVVTASNDGGDLGFTAAAHGLITNNRITFTNAGGALPAGIVAGVVYHVIEETAGTFKVASERGGESLSFSDAGTGVHTVVFGGLSENITIEPREVSKFDTSRVDVVEL